jgi:uncharacterized protein YcfJ
MPFKTLGFAGCALVAAAMLAPAAASAQYYAAPPAYADDSGRDSDRGFYARRGYGRDRPPPRRADYRERRVERCGRGDAGMILGAIAGGLLGNGGGGRHGNHAAGALSGGAADRDCD